MFVTDSAMITAQESARERCINCTLQMVSLVLRKQIALDITDNYTIIQLVIHYELNPIGRRFSECGNDRVAAKNCKNKKIR